MIEIKNLTKRFGPVAAVDDLSFTAEPGRVAGLLGPNGAGKTTTLRVLLGLNKPTAGTATIDGRDFRTLGVGLRHVGALLNAEVGLESAARRRVGTYSPGMKQRLGIAAALLGDPPVLGR